MKIAFGLIVFNSDHVLEQAIKSVQPFGRVYACEGPVGYWRGRGYATSEDRTNKILDTLGVETVHGQWKEKTEMCNQYAELIPNDVDFVWHIDADEVWDPDTIESIIKILESGKVDSMSFKAWSFFGGFERILGGFEEQFEVHRIKRWYPGARWDTHRPPTVLAQDGVPWRKKSHMGHEETDRLGLRFFHYSYVFPSQAFAKHDYYSAGWDYPIEDWPTKVFMPWVTGSVDERMQIESKYEGVHNFKPSYRGPAHSRPFDGIHPPEIRRCWGELIDRFEEECIEYSRSDLR